MTTENSGGAARVAYEWRDNLACVATYTVLEADKFLDQFEDADIPFDKAGVVKLGNLKYYPKATTNSDIQAFAASEAGKAFWYYVIKTYAPKKERANDSSASLLREVQAVFADPKKTIADLAGVIDGCLKFGDEGGASQ